MTIYSDAAFRRAKREHTKINAKLAFPGGSIPFGDLVQFNVYWHYHGKLWKCTARNNTSDNVIYHLSVCWKAAMRVKIVIAKRNVTAKILCLHMRQILKISANTVCNFIKARNLPITFGTGH